MNLDIVCPFFVLTLLLHNISLFDNICNSYEQNC